jgi:hypothetical protein
MPDTEAKTEDFYKEDPYKNGPYVVLSDGSTYDGLEGCIVAWLTDEGEEKLEECNDISDANHPDLSAHITVGDLLDAYNKVHGTNF